MGKNKLISNPATSYLKQNSGIIIATVVVFIAMSVVKGDIFLSPLNLANVLRQCNTNLLLTFGMTFALLIGGIDLTVGSVVAASGCLMITLLYHGTTSLPVAILAALSLGVISGLIVAFIINITNLPAFIVTLAMQKIIRGVGYICVNGSPLKFSSPSLKFIGNGSLGGIPVPVLISAIVTLVMLVLLNQTSFGRHIYAMGGNLDAALFSGINVKKTRLSVYAISGLLAAIAGVILAARMYSGQPELASGYESNAIAAAVLGGVRFTGGVGTIGGALLGALFIGVLTNAMNLMGISSYMQEMIQGVIILAAVIMDFYRRERA